MNNRITKLFANEKGDILSIFYTAGYPKLEDTIAVARCLDRADVDMIEIGIPFSDPIADGPVIQESSTIALRNGMTVKKLLEQVREIRKNSSIPLILMGYLNPVLQYGVAKFCEEASQSGVDALILPDMPLDEYLQEYRSQVESCGLSNIFLIAPTTSEERIRRIDDATNGFIYAVSASSTTGVKGTFSADQENYFKKLGSMKLKNPFLIGFGISNHQSFSKACQYGAGGIVGSAFIHRLKDSLDLEKDIPLMVNEIRS